MAKQNNAGGAPKKILIIDDEPDIVMFLMDFFSQSKFSTQGAFSGTEGLQKAASFGPDLVLLDLRMGPPGGLEILQTLRNLCPAAKVIMLTAETSTVEMEKALKLGASHYLIKPLRLEELESEVRRVLED